MRRFDYGFLKDRIPGQLVILSNVISGLHEKEKMRRAQDQKTFEELTRSALTESVKESNVIDGIIVAEDRINDLMNGAAPVSQEEKKIAGYRDALSLIHSENRVLDFTETFILQMHKMVSGAVSAEEAGNYKKNSNLIIGYDSDNRRHIRFRPVEAAETPAAMEQLILAYMDARQDQDIPDLLLIPCVILDFLCIYPFADGNGRVSRLLMNLLLYKHDHEIGRYISAEHQINKNLDAYYEALEKSSAGWHSGENDYVPFMVFFMQILYASYKDLDDKFAEGEVKKAKKSERVRTVIFNSIVPISKQEIAEKVPDVSVKTVELVLQSMNKKGEIRKVGTFRDAKYIRM